MGVGGSNFGWAGSMLSGINGSVYSKSVTQSYDFDAPVTESGDPHPTKFAAVRAALLHGQGPLPPLPAADPKGAWGSVSMTRAASLLQLRGAAVAAAEPASFSSLGAGLTSMVLYTSNASFGGEARLDVGALRDRGTVLLDGQLQGTVSAWSPATTTRSDRGRAAAELIDQLATPFDPPGSVSLRPESAASSSHRIDILVENLGRPCDSGSLRFGLTVGWRGCRNVSLEASGADVALGPWSAEVIDFASLAQRNASWKDGLKGQVSDGWSPSLYEGALTIAAGPTASAGSFLRVDGTWGGGMAAVNGWVLGRFEQASAQRTLYVPRTVLRSGRNAVLLLESSPSADGLKGSASAPRTVRFVDAADLGPSIPLKGDDSLAALLSEIRFPAFEDARPLTQRTNLSFHTRCGGLP